MSSLKSFAFPTQRRAGAGRVHGTDGHVGHRPAAGRVRVAPGPWRRPRPPSRRSTGSRRRACGPGRPLPARPLGARRRPRPPPPAGARRCCCGCARSAGPRRGARRRARTLPKTTRRMRTRRRRPPRARRAGRRPRRGWRSSAGRPARSSRRGARARRWARAPGLQREAAGRQRQAWALGAPRPPVPACRHGPEPRRSAVAWHHTGSQEPEFSAPGSSPPPR